MREVKFRAWDNVADKMFYCGEDIDVFFTLGSEGIECTDIRNVGPSGDGVDSMEHLIYMQYTGIKDKYEKEIYEADITTNELYKSEGVAFIVYYDNEKGMFKQRPFMFKDNGRKVGPKDLTLQMDSVENKEIIGNIYENPELLEVQHD